MNNHDVTDIVPIGEDPDDHERQMQLKWLEKYIESAGNVLESCVSLNITWKQYDSWCRNSKWFAEMRASAQNIANEVLESEALRRAFKGAKIEKRTKLGEPYTETVYSDKLMLEMLKARMPGKYHIASQESNASKKSDAANRMLEARRRTSMNQSTSRTQEPEYVRRNNRRDE